MGGAGSAPHRGPKVAPHTNAALVQLRWSYGRYIAQTQSIGNVCLYSTKHSHVVAAVIGWIAVYSAEGKTCFQSFFMSTTIQPFSTAASSALSRWPNVESRS